MLVSRWGNSLAIRLPRALVDTCVFDRDETNAR